ncbi:MAG: nucleotidyltransferase family protein, partial [Anaerolineales bacterium]|nr:nucleotidyltransferase family protein [Anaerolineales bacterium]
MVDSKEEVDGYLLKTINEQIEGFLPEIPSEKIWHTIYRRAERHGIAPLIYWRFHRVRSSIPQPVFDRFKQTYLTTLGRNRIFLAELDRVVNLLCSEGIKVVLLKGAVFVRSLYEDIGLRPMSDLDILLHKGDIPKAVWILKQNGYEEPILHQSELLKQDVTHDV